MSLLKLYTSKGFEDLANQIFQDNFDRDPKLSQELNERQKHLMYQDVLYNLSFLETAIHHNDEKMFVEYTKWLMGLLCHLMKRFSLDRIKEQMITHFLLVKEHIEKEENIEYSECALSFLDSAIDAIKNYQESALHEDASNIEKEPYASVKRAYLDALLNTDTKKAMEIILNLSEFGVDLPTVYNILKEVMVEVGELWHKNKITVDKEHYCTVTTQNILAQFYPEIFSKEKKEFRILACCVGDELHELGMRMLSDIFEYNGWDSIYLGSVVPVESIVHSVEENQPDLVALSVTMPQHLSLCKEAVQTIKETYPDMKVAVGGRAFQVNNIHWEDWGADVSAESAVKLYQWAKEYFE
ncbi:MAG TPA: cobalamin-binding protein [Eubacteriaceae bacterium]|nr:cobalamin-binding protein [Eubacteriaceae bacterium]